MNWNDKGIIVSSRKFAENSLIVNIMTSSHGLHYGVVRHYNSKTSRATYQPGNIVFATWKARLPEHLGMFSCELLETIYPDFLSDRTRLACLVSSCAVVDKALPEREVQKDIFDALLALLIGLRDDKNWKEKYVMLELEILKRLGFGLDLERCAASGEVDNLAYVSPKTGRAVSATAGEGYKEKLLPLPEFLAKSAEKCQKEGEIIDGIRLTGYFLEKHIFVPGEKNMPQARARFVEIITGLMKV